MGTVKRQYKPKKENIIKLSNYLKKDKDNKSKKQMVWVLEKAIKQVGGVMQMRVIFGVLFTLLSQGVAISLLQLPSSLPQLQM